MDKKRKRNQQAAVAASLTAVADGNGEEEKHFLFVVGWTVCFLLVSASFDQTADPSVCGDVWGT